jgi:hypothetical protein
MKRIIFLVLTITLVACVLQMSLMYDAKAGVPPSGSTVVTGTVTDFSTGKAITGATVTSSAGVSQTIQEPSYQYLFTYDSSNTPFTLTASKNGYKTETVVLTTAPGGIITRNIELHPLFSITLTTSAATLAVGETETVTATVKDENGNPLMGYGFLFTITSGPNEVYYGSSSNDPARFCVTDQANRQAYFTYTSRSGVAGTDTILAELHDPLDNDLPFSATATVTWSIQMNVPESPFGTLGVLLASALGGAAFIGLPKLRKKL